MQHPWQDGPWIIGLGDPYDEVLDLLFPRRWALTANGDVNVEAPSFWRADSLIKLAKLVGPRRAPFLPVKTDEHHKTARATSRDAANRLLAPRKLPGRICILGFAKSNKTIGCVNHSLV